MSDTTLKLKILIVEDEVLLRNALAKIFSRFGHDVQGVDAPPSFPAVRKCKQM